VGILPPGASAVRSGSGTRLGIPFALLKYRKGDIPLLDNDFI
jgi:hypothetical protein